MEQAKRDPDKRTTFTLPRTGMYWVTANIRPCSDPIVGTVQIGSENLFNIYAEKVKAVSNSGAYRFTAGSTILLYTRAGDVCYEADSLLSVVYLVANEKAYTHPFENLAFTARTQNKQTFSSKQVIDFQHVLTNYGYMYVDGYTEIRRTRYYMVALRPDPESASIVATILYINERPYWAGFAQQGVPAGGTISLNLQVGTYLCVTSFTNSLYGTGTMFSIAFIQP